MYDKEQFCCAWKRNIHIVYNVNKIEQIRLQKLLPFDCYITCDGHILEDNEPLVNGKVYHVNPRIPGGKGGFGSMLRAIGAQIEKTTNHEACRDISGRRMRDVNNEKKLKEWLSKKAEKDREREREQQERREKRKALPNHKFEDETYHQQRKKVAEDQEDALMQGLQKVNKAGPSCTVTSEMATTSGVKRKTAGSEQGPSAKSRKQNEWLGIDIDDLSDLDSDDSSSAQPDNSSSNNENSSDSYPHTVGNEKLKFEACRQNDADCKSCDFDAKSDSTKSSQSNKEQILKSDSKSENPNKLLESLKNIPLKEEKSEGNSEISEKLDMENEPVNLENYNSVEELQSLGLERLKMALMDRKMKCGGNLEQRAERLFSVKGLTDDEIPSCLLAKPIKKK